MRLKNSLGLGLAAVLTATTLGGCRVSVSSHRSADPDTNGLTPPGTELKFGETATVPLEGEGIAKITVSAVEKADPADLAGLKDTKYDPSKHDAYYIRYDVRIVSENGVGIQNVDLISDLGLRATKPEKTVDLWNVKSCHIDRTLLQAVDPGDSFVNCLPEYLPKGTPLDGARFSDPNSDYDQFEGQPVIWRD
jgi:hypothetical protein